MASSDIGDVWLGVSDRALAETFFRDYLKLTEKNDAHSSWFELSNTKKIRLFEAEIQFGGTVRKHSVEFRVDDVKPIDERLLAAYNNDLQRMEADGFFRSMSGEEVIVSADLGSSRIRIVRGATG